MQESEIKSVIENDVAKEKETFSSPIPTACDGWCLPHIDPWEMKCSAWNQNRTKLVFCFQLCPTLRKEYIFLE